MWKFRSWSKNCMAQYGGTFFGPFFLSNFFCCHFFLANFLFSPNFHQFYLPIFEFLARKKNWKGKVFMCTNLREKNWREKKPKLKLPPNPNLDLRWWNCHLTLIITHKYFFGFFFEIGSPKSDSLEKKNWREKISSHA